MTHSGIFFTVLSFGIDDPCIPNPCDNTGTGETTCVTTSANIAQCVCSTGFELESSLGPCFGKFNFSVEPRKIK